MLHLLSLLFLLPLSSGCWLPPSHAQEKHQKGLYRGAHAASNIGGCTVAEAEWQFDTFRRHEHESKYLYTACAPHQWLRRVAELNSDSPRRTAVIDIGCNKGYFTATALNYLAKGFGSHPDLLYQSHLSRGVYSAPCGACKECKEVPIGGPVTSNAQHSVDVFCFEPSEIHQTSLRMARDTVYGSPDAPFTDKGTIVRWNVRPLAVSNRTGVAHFPVNCTVNTCSIGDVGVKLQAVNITTVDAEMERPEMPGYIDILKVDTEGFDPSVLAGAYHTLRNHRAGVLSFEYHLFWKRSGGTLRQCMNYLEELGYSCFYDGPKTAKLTGCWDPRYEIQRWSNIVCAIRGSDMEAELLAGSFIANNLTSLIT